VQQELVNVRRELEINRDRATVEIQSLGRGAQATRVLADQLAAAPRADQLMVSDTLVWLAVMYLPSFDPVLGAAEALIASGRLAQIASPDVRMGLAGLRDRLADAMEEEVTARLVSVEQLIPLLRDRTDLDQPMSTGVAYLTNASGAGLTPQARMIGRAMESEGDISFPNSAAIRNTLLMKYAWQSVAGSEFASLMPRLDELIELVTIEIDER
jgi:hypothetical protein